MSRDELVEEPAAGRTAQRSGVLGALLILMAGLLGAAAAGVGTAEQDIEYQATVTLIAQGATGTDSSETLGRTVIALLTSSAIASDVADAVPGGLTPAQIRSKITAERPPGSSVIEVTYQDTDADAAAKVAQALVPAFLARTDSLGSDASGAPQIVPWDSGSGVVVALEPPVARNAAIGGLLGAALAVFTLMLIRGARLRPRSRTEEDPSADPAAGAASEPETQSDSAPGAVGRESSRE